MREKLKRAQEKLGQTWEEYQSFRNRLPSDETKWTAEQREKFDAMDADLDRLEVEIRGIQRDINDEERNERFHQTNGGAQDYGPPLEFRQVKRETTQRGAHGDDAFDFRADPNGRTERHAFNRYLLHGDRALTPQEFRTLQSGGDIDGGYLNAPEIFAKQLIKSLDDEVFMRKYASHFDVKNGVSLGAPVLDSDVDDADWTAELLTGNEDTGLAFGKRELKPYPCAKRIKVSNKLLRTAALNPENIVRQRLSYKFGVTEEQAFMTGDGHNKPLGLFVASSDGISTGRDVTGSNTTTTIKADTLIDAQYAIKGQYAKKGTWIFSREAIRDVRKLKDANDQYLWRSGLAGSPATILERPYEISEYCPNTFTAGQYVGLFGDLSFYWIATALQMQVQRLNELYAEQNITGFIGRLEVDGMPVLEEAFARIQLAAS
ncbi:hypothetical protein DSCO28_17600 [Desulfosarcina ovata subsp. sediminis]|uniref:Phage capsid-like C-terminal domain-containing protein n=1 Tax=Desulfosarcina ovata subsp. sediminis TaxID=885957 RepID=A0A5K7ZIH3_9BACT|nr:phage major capsid protein [Desulfosarcina ovata]BBO81194.1 hypothetical protein DSCO28_17600 [Desulfosarcina ovata subsp. sediminis]